MFSDTLIFERYKQVVIQPNVATEHGSRLIDGDVFL